MVMIRPQGKSQKVAKAVLKSKGIKTPSSKSYEKVPVTTPYLQH